MERFGIAIPHLLQVSACFGLCGNHTRDGLNFLKLMTLHFDETLFCGKKWVLFLLEQLLLDTVKNSELEMHLEPSFTKSKPAY